MRQILLILCLIPTLFARERVSGQAGAAQQKLQYIVLAAMDEDETTWLLEDITDEHGYKEQGESYVIDDSIDPSTHYFEATMRYTGERRIQLRLSEPLPIIGITKTISLWCKAEEEQAFGLRGIVSDPLGFEYKLLFANYCVPGWKKYTVGIPSRIPQRFYVYPRTEHGISFLGLEIVIPRDTELGESITVGIDTISAITDYFSMESRDGDEISW